MVKKKVFSTSQVCCFFYMQIFTSLFLELREGLEGQEDLPPLKA